MAEETKVETMEDYAAELEASFKKVRTGDNLTGVIIDVTDEKIVVDLKYYAEGIILKEDINADPDYSLKEEYHVGDEITATVVKTDDGEGNILLSLKQAKEESAWEKLERMMEERTVLEVKIAEVVKSGVVAYVDGIRGFIPASKLSDGYVEDLETFNGKTIGVTVITADKEHKKLVLSGREVARQKRKEEKNARIAKCEVGAVMEGTVDSIMPYGAFIELENGLSGLLHVSRISKQRIKHPSVVLKEGDIISIDTGAIVDGWVGDNAWTYAVGKISPEKKRLLDVTERCMWAGLDAARPGNRLGDIGHAVQSVAEEAGYGVVREYVGHGIGRDMHEDPNVPNFGRKHTGVKLEEGMVLAIEPMINLGTYKTRQMPDGWLVCTRDGLPSAHFEKTVAITEDGPVILTTEEGHRRPV